MCCVR